MEKLARLIYYGIIIFLIYYLFPFFLPFIFALVFAVICEPLVMFLINKIKIKRVFAVTIVFSSVFIIIFTFFYHIISKFVKEAFSLAKLAPKQIEEFVSEHQKLYEIYSNLPEDMKKFINDTFGSLFQKVTDFVTTYAGDLFSVIKNFPHYFIAFLIFLVATYIIGLEMPKLKSIFLNFFASGKSRQKVEIVLERLRELIIGFLQAQVILSTLTFVIAAIGLSILDVPYIFLLGFSIVLVDLLPILGTGSVLVPWSIYAFVSGNYFLGFGLIALFLFITLFRRIIEPKLLADSIGLKPLPTLISLYVGFSLLGFIGMVVGPAIVIVIKALEEANLIKIELKV